MTKRFALLMMVVMVLGMAGCKDEEPAGPDASEVTSALDNPTGTVATAEDAQGVAAAFVETQSAMGGGAGAPGGETYEQTTQCPAGGDMTMVAEGSSEEDVTIDFSYNNCCQEEACCMNGGGWAAVGGGAYELCYSYDVDYACGGENANLVVQYCQDAEGVAWYVVEYSGATYAVSGSYMEGYGGTWTIRDANSTWECSESCDGMGTCTGSCTDGSTTVDW